MKKVYLLLLMACISFAGYAQTAASYTFSRTSGTFTSIVGGSGTTTLSDATACTNGTGTSVNSDNGSTTITLPINFTFCGTNYTAGSSSVALDANGVMSLGNNGASATQSTSNIGGNGFLMPLWADLYGICKNVYYQTTGSVGSRIFTVEWNNWSVCCSGSAAALTFQVKLYEGTNIIQFVYGSSSGSAPTNAVIGIANSTSDFQTLVSTSSSSTNTGFNNFCTEPATGTVLQWCIPPTTYALTGGGAYCSGGIGVAVGLTSSQSGISYQLYDNGSPVGSAVSGTGSAINFGNETVAGTYTVVANATSSCATTQSGNSIVTINSLPTAYSVGGGGGYCPGSAGAVVNLASSTTGVSYQLFLGTTAVGSPVLGTGSSINFAAVTGVGTYTVVGTNFTTGCASNMTGNAAVSVNPLPGEFSLTGGGAYCLGASGVLVGLSGSSTGVSYQLYNGSIPTGSSVSGTGSAISFGTETSATGATTYTAIATSSLTTCTVAMSGTAVVTLNLLPTVYSVTGGGTYCLGGTGVAVNMGNSTIGVNYQLYNGTSMVGTIAPGTGAGFTFGNQTASGSYTVVAQNASTGCINNMFGSAAVTIAPLPNVYTITGGGGYCAGGTGVPVGLSSSSTSTNYYLYYSTGGTPGLVGSATSGTGSAISFGAEILAGTYTIVATSTASPFCSANMSGSVAVTINPLPVSTYSVTGGGTYCSGGTGVPVGLSGSTPSINYQLFNGTTAMGAPIAGGGTTVTFPNQTASGSYTIVATNPATLCSSNMTGSVGVTINPLPTAFAMTGGGGFCIGGTGVHVGVSTSNSGISYQLYNNTGSGPVALGSASGGTGAPIDFGLEAAAGTYTVIATNTTTSCTNNMSGSSVVVINTLPAVYSVSSTNPSYCAGGAGSVISMSGSALGVNYQLMNGTTMMGAPMAGSGSGFSFPAQTATGTYTVVANNPATTCNNNMSGSVTVSINPLPTVYAVTGGGLTCAGVGTHVGTTSSTAGINYQLYLNGSSTGAPVTAVGTAVDFGAETTSGTYTVIATNTTTSCSSSMSGMAIVSVNAAPTAYLISGGGNYCSGGTGVPVGVGNSTIGVNYQLYNGTTLMGAPVSGTGSSISFGSETMAGTYTVVGTVMSTGCEGHMTGSTTVSINALPTVHNVTGGGGYCHGGTGSMIGLDYSDAGISYRVYDGTTPVGSAAPGVNAALSIGSFTATGTYTVLGTNTSTGCSSNMAGTAGVSVYPLPLIYNVTGGGHYCAGGMAGVNISLSNTTLGVTYNLYNGGLLSGTKVGTGLPITFDSLTTGGTYLVQAVSTVGCIDTMHSTAMVVVSPLPNAYPIGGGGNYCAGTGGLHITLSGSDSNIHYQLMNTSIPTGSAIVGTGHPLDFGAQTAAGSYTILATNVSTTCQNTMTGSEAINIIALPNAYSVMGGGAYCSGTGGRDVSVSSSDAGVHYQLYDGSSMVGSYMTGTGSSSVDFGNQVAAGVYSVIATDPSTTCSAAMTGTVGVTINPLPTNYIVSGGGAYCAGTGGVHVLLSGSNSGVSYQLLNPTATGAPVSGTGMSIDLGAQTVAATYKVLATNTGTGCVDTMSTSVNVSINPLPNRYSTLSVGSNFCAGGTGIPVSLSNSDAGITYQLYNGTATSGGPVAGTGSGISFGNQTAAGLYRIEAVNTTTGCTDTMNSTASVVVNPLPNVYSMTGGGNYCAGTSGTHIGLTNSTVSIEYVVMLNGVSTGDTVGGLATAIDFGLETATGTYTVVAINPATTCWSNMSGTAAISVSPAPMAYTITSGSTSVCAGTTGTHFGLTNSTLDISYQLMNGTSISGAPVAGTGTSIDFGTRNTSGAYTVLATNSITGCTSNMTGTINLTVNPLPTSYSVTGGGGYCPGTGGVHVGLSGSSSGTSYQLYLDGMPVGGSILGGGSPSTIDFGLQDSAGAYTVVATTSLTGCTNTMSGSASVVINPLPTSYVVTGGGSYCAGGTGVHIGLSNSASGVNYTLYNVTSSHTITVISGTGSPLDFGLDTAAGTYTVSATNASTTCTNDMSGSATITVIPTVVPTVAVSTGIGDTLCSGNFTTFTAVTTNAGLTPTYNWTVNGVSASTGSSYSYIPANGDNVGVTVTSSAACASPARAVNSISLTVLPQELPTANVSSNDGFTVCLGTPVTLTANTTYAGSGASYQWFVGGTASSATTSSITITPSNGEHVYCIVTSTYRCRLNSTATAPTMTFEVDTPAIPVVSLSLTPGNHIGNGQNVVFTATALDAGPTPTYQWYVNSIPVVGETYPTFSYDMFHNLDSVTCKVTSSGGCSGLVGQNSVEMYVSNVGVAQVNGNTANLTIAPNPNRGNFFVKGSLGLTTEEEVTLQITDMLGQVVYTTKVTTQNGTINQNIQLANGLANGTYLLNVHSASIDQVFHLVVEQ
jgi:Secretion system C-terminal sorting domain/Ig-like domain CHU_C associated